MGGRQEGSAVVGSRTLWIPKRSALIDPVHQHGISDAHSRRRVWQWGKRALSSLCLLPCLLSSSWAEAQVGEQGASVTEGPRRMSDAAELERVIDLYLSGQYERCIDALNPWIDERSAQVFVERPILERGRLYFASCAVLSGHTDRAREVLQWALESNPLMASPDSLTFPPPVIALFLEVREEVQALISRKEQEQIERLLRENEQERQRVAERKKREIELARLAEEQPIIVQSSRTVAWLPFGAGQYQNGDENLGHVFLVSEILMAGTAATSAGILLDLYIKGIESLKERRNIAPGEVSKFEAAHTVMTISTLSLIGTMALGIVEANLNFKERRVVGVQKRKLPAHLTTEEDASGESPERDVLQSSGSEVRFSPYSVVSGDGVQFGIVGSF